MMTRGFADPFDGVRSLQREMNRLFESAGGSDSYPAANLWSNENEALLTAELPGLCAECININVSGDQISIEGERKEDEIGENSTYHRKERGHGKFIRSFRLPFDVDSEKVAAKYADGVLKVTLPRAEASKPRKIAISEK
jgi:HSP20 family protein